MPLHRQCIGVCALPNAATSPDENHQLIAAKDMVSERMCVVEGEHGGVWQPSKRTARFECTP